mgnify:CR=1 FL=1
MISKFQVRDSLLLRFLLTFITFALLFQVQRICFMLYYHDHFSGVSFGEMVQVLWHGIPMDLSCAGYLTAVPGLLFTAAAVFGYGGKALRGISYIYVGIVSLLVSAVFIVDLVLYDYWGFRIDFTPVFYFLSSPKDAMASAGLWQILLGIVSLAFVTLINFLVLRFVMMKKTASREGVSRILTPVVLLVLTAGLFLPIRGGVNPTTMNPSKAYFSQNQILNHSAINPDFNLLYSVSHQSHFDRQYRFMEPDRAQELFGTMTDKPVSASVPRLLRPEYYPEPGREASRLDIILVMLESFSTHLMKSMGGEDIAVNLDRIASEGLLFTDFYANSFRTDRATPAIISGFPSQPSTSIMKYVSKTEKLPSIPHTLKDNGYDIAFYYGGDATFTNLQTYLVSCGFEKIVSEKDFPVSQRTGKWGANDGALFDRFLDDYLEEKPESPRFRIVQTSSSHDPFDVPDYNVLPDIRANAFSYTDMCLGKFMDRLSSSSQWGNTLVIMVPDHWAAYPDGNTLSTRERHSIPLVMTGGALAMKGRNSTVSSQIDIAATLLYQLGISHEEFAFSKNILNPDSPHFAYISEPSVVGIVKENNMKVLNCDAGVLIEEEGEDPENLDEERIKAFVQKLYDEIEAL